MTDTTSAGVAAQAPRTRRTQAERTAATRAKVLDAAVDVLVEHGHAATTTQEVNRRAGVSRGALLHHFPTREALLVAAVGHLVDRRLAEILQTRHDPDVDIGIVVDAFSGPLFDAALELWVAARTDPGLRDAVIPLEHKVGEAITTASRELFGDRYSRTQLDLSVELARGLAVSAILRDPDDHRAYLDRLLPAWKDLLTHA